MLETKSNYVIQWFVNPSDFILHDNESLLLRRTKNIAEKWRWQNIKAFHFHDHKQTNSRIINISIYYWFMWENDTVYFCNLPCALENICPEIRSPVKQMSAISNCIFSKRLTYILLSPYFVFKKHLYFFTQLNVIKYGSILPFLLES